MRTRPPPLPAALSSTEAAEIANRLHSHAIALLRRARSGDRELELTPERLSLLSVLAYAGPKTVGELAGSEMVSAPAISRILGALESDGLIRRVRGAQDRRQVYAHATEAGKALMERGRAARVSRIAAELTRLQPEELAILATAMTIFDQLGQRSEPAQ